MGVDIDSPEARARAYALYRRIYYDVQREQQQEKQEQMKPYRDWIVLALIVTAFGCCVSFAPACAPGCQQAGPTTPTDTTVVEVVHEPSGDIPAPPSDDAPGCPAACKTVEALGCPGWAPEGGTCAQGCPLAVEALGEAVNLACVAKAKSCQEASGCIR